MQAETLSLIRRVRANRCRVSGEPDSEDAVTLGRKEDLVKFRDGDRDP